MAMKVCISPPIGEEINYPSQPFGDFLLQPLNVRVDVFAL